MNKIRPFVLSSESKYFVFDLVKGGVAVRTVVSVLAVRLLLLLDHLLLPHLVVLKFVD